MKKWRIFLSILFAIILFTVLIYGRNINLICVLGSLFLSSLYSLVQFYTLRVTIDNCEKEISKYLWFFICVFSFCVLTLSLMRPGIGWDSWQVYDMSKYVFSDFGYMDQIRQHIVNTHYEMAFPPVFPYLMAIVNSIFDMGVYSSVYLNAVFELLCFVELLKIYKFKDLETIGSISTVAIFCGSLYVLTYILGLSQTLGYYLLILLCRVIFIEEKYDSIYAVKCGVLSGLLLMNRFDALAIVAVVFITIPFLMYGKANVKDMIINSIVFCGTVVLICSPWIIYSIAHFDSIFITDNGRRLFNIQDTRPSTFFPANNPALTIRDSFSMWLIAFSGRALLATCSLLASIIRYTVVFEVLVGCYVIYKKKIKDTVANIHIDKKVCAVIAIILGQEVLFILTGYSDLRYHLPILFVIQLFTFRYLIHSFRSFNWKRTSLLLVVCLALLSYAKVGYVTNPIKAVNSLFTGEGYHKDLVLTEQEQQIKEYLLNDCNTICFYRAENEFNFLKFSAESQISNIISPANISTQNVYEFVDTFEINYLYSSNEQVIDIFNSKLKLINTPFENLYKVEKKEI